MKRSPGKKVAVLLFIVFVACSATAVEAGTLVNRNGVVWASTFEGDVAALTASSPAWGIFDKGGPGVTESTDGNIYSYTSVTVGRDASAVSYSIGTDFAGTGNVRTVEARVRVPSTLALDGAGSILLGVNDNAYDVRLYSDHLGYNGAGGVAAPANIIPVDLTQFQTIRIIVDRTSSPNYRLFLNNNPTPVFTSNDVWFTSPGFDNLIFGDISFGGLQGTVEVDYISWTPGAFVPVPEPASLFLLAAGGCAVCIVRRRNS